MVLRRLILFAAVMLITLIPAGNVSADDVVVDPGGLMAPGQRVDGSDNGIIWTSLDIGYLVYMTTSSTTSAELKWIKTVDSGTTWSSPVTIVADVGDAEPVAGFNVWFDRWTSGNVGTLIHIGYTCRGTVAGGCDAIGGAGTGSLRYVNLDVSNDVLSTDIKVAQFGGGSDIDPGGVSIVKTDSGRVYLRGEVGSSVSNEMRMSYSDNDGISWTSANAGVFGDPVPQKLAPAIENSVLLVGENDIFAYSKSGGVESILQYQASSDTWTQIFDLNARGISNFTKSETIAVNPTTGSAAAGSGSPYTFYGFLEAPDSSTYENFQVVRQDANSTLSIVTPVFENTGTNYWMGSLLYDDSNDLLYASYIDINTDEIYYKVSDDAGDTWGVETRFDNTANAKTDVALASATTRANGRLMPIWEEGTALVTELDSVVEFETSPDVDEKEFPNKLDRFRTGLNLTGNTGEVAFALGSAFLLAVVTIAFGMPKILMVVLEFFWLTAMAMPPIEYLPAGIYLSAFLVMGVLFVFLLINTIFGSRTSGEDF